MGIKTQIDVNAGTVTFTAADGDQLVFRAENAHPGMRAYAEFHGWKQRLSDTAALSRNNETGRSATDSERMREIRRLAAYYESGADNWSVRASGEARETGGLVLRAVAAIQGVSVEEMRERLTAKAEKLETTERKLLNQLAKSPAVMAKMEELAPVSEEEQLNADQLLEEIGQ